MSYADEELVEKRLTFLAVAERKLDAGGSQRAAVDELVALGATRESAEPLVAWVGAKWKTGHRTKGRTMIVAVRAVIAAVVALSIFVGRLMLIIILVGARTIMKGTAGLHGSKAGPTSL